jgi:hypothetical protein
MHTLIPCSAYRAGCRAQKEAQRKPHIDRSATECAAQLAKSDQSTHKGVSLQVQALYP